FTKDVKAIATATSTAGCVSRLARRPGRTEMATKSRPIRAAPAPVPARKKFVKSLVPIAPHSLSKALHQPEQASKIANHVASGGGRSTEVIIAPGGWMLSRRDNPRGGVLKRERTCGGRGEMRC